MEDGDPEVDVVVRYSGTIVLVEPVTDRAKIWLEENVVGERTWFRGQLVVERRYAGDLVRGMETAGLKLVEP